MIGAFTAMAKEPGADNVVVLPNLMSGDLADLVAAAGARAQASELRGEIGARTAFRAAVDSWPTRKRHLRRTPAVVALTTMATVLVATTGLAAATVVPGPTGRAVEGFLGSVGVNIGAPAGPTTPTATPAPTSFAHRAGYKHAGCSVGGTSVTGSANGVVHTSSCVVTAPLHPLPPPTVHTSVSKVVPAPKVPKVPNAPKAPKAPPVAHASGRPSVDPPTPTTTLPGGGTSRGGNLGGGGGGGCKGSSVGGGTTTTTDPATTTTTTPAGASSTAAGCGHHGAHHGAHHGGAGPGSTATTTTTTTTTAPSGPAE